MIAEETIIITILLLILTVVMPRKYFLVPFVVTACFIPADQRVIVMGLDFTPLRLLVLAGVLRVCVRGELRTIRFNKFDKILLLWVFCGAAVYVVQWLDIRALIYKCGMLYDVLGLYWLFRQNIRSWTTVHLVFTVFALCAAVMLPLVAFEWVTGRNPFIILGRVYTAVRESGRYRCQASFPHSIIFGLFWATLVPIFVGLGLTQRRKFLYWIACAASVFMVLTTNSSTPVGTLIVVLLLLALFRYRAYGRQIAYGTCAMVLVLHLIMQAPVWHLISRINLIIGSTGYHRYRLIDGAIGHFGEWAMMGTRSTSHWGRGLEDITNYYVRQGVTGGLITLLLFVILLVTAVRIVGGYSISVAQPKQRVLAWCVCVSILGHCVAFLGISYFGQVRMLLYLVFAIVALIYEMSMNEFQTSKARIRGRSGRM